MQVLVTCGIDVLRSWLSLGGWVGFLSVVFTPYLVFILGQELGQHQAYSSSTNEA